MGTDLHSRTPRLDLGVFTGPLERLLELARAHRIDLSRISVPALVDQLSAALQQQTPLADKGDWVVMVAWLLMLRSRLLLPASEPSQQAAHAGAEVLRGRMLALGEMQSLAAWLGRQPLLGHDVFARGRPDPISPPPGAAMEVDVVEFLWASLGLFDDDLAPAETRQRYRPIWDDLFSIAEARDRIMLRLSGTGSQPMERLLPDGVVNGVVQARSRWTSTFVASLELAKQGSVLMGQETGFGPIQVSPAHCG